MGTWKNENFSVIRGRKILFLLSQARERHIDCWAYKPEFFDISTDGKPPRRFLFHWTRATALCLPTNVIELVLLCVCIYITYLGSRYLTRAQQIRKSLYCNIRPFPSRSTTGASTPTTAAAAAAAHHTAHTQLLLLARRVCSIQIIIIYVQHLDILNFFFIFARRLYFNTTIILKVASFRVY